ncbi:ERBB receptor feedback inhibitor 1a [Electrophorus electricus]|uniref:Mig-6 domain-containing protein n=1 Tax=Electrophorus electricus TaxID=8005 RepID=A0A4W4FXW8_ELEEL|nr:ERBB receptor feedback inhibitor 1a [Electrophorus electricus]
MSTAGLTAQEICLPTQSLFLRGSCCPSMDGTKPSWKYNHDCENLYLSIDPAVSCNLQPHKHEPSFLAEVKQRFHSHSQNCTGTQPLPPKKSRPTQLSLSSTVDPFNPSPIEDDQVVPGFQRLCVSERASPPQTPSRVAKPLPPIPGSAELSADQATDIEVEFFTGDDSRCLVPDPCPKPSPFRYSMHSRRSFRDGGQINYAYLEGPVSQQKKQQQQSKKKQDHEVQGSIFPQQHEQELHEQQHMLQVACLRQQDRAQRKLRRSHSGPAGSFNKPSALRLCCQQRNTHGLDKPEVPPRIPIPPRPAKTPDCRRWSAEVSSGPYSDEDRPPKVPPREPLSSSVPRTPSPKSLPIYLNGIMPPTQSFAPDPKYVSRGLQRQNSEGSPCILPVMENGRKASTTHYFLLPQRPAYLDKHEKYFLDDTIRSTDATSSGLDLAGQSKKKIHSDFV